MMYKVYILYSVIKDKYYIGHTDDILRRVTEHNSKGNLDAKDWELKYTEEYPTRTGAMKREQEIKSKKRRTYLESLIISFG